MDGKLYEGIIKVKSQKAKPITKLRIVQMDGIGGQRSVALIFFVQEKNTVGNTILTTAKFIETKKDNNEKDKHSLLDFYRLTGGTNAHERYSEPVVNRGIR